MLTALLDLLDFLSSCVIIDISKSSHELSEGHKLRHLLEDVLVQSRPENKDWVTCSPQVTKFSVKKVNRRTVIDTLQWYKIWQHSGYNHSHVGNTAKQCRLGLFQDSDFAGDLEDSKSTSGGTLCVFGSHTFVPTSWMCKKQTSVSHSSTESEIISLDTGLRLDGLPALELWDLIVSVLGNISRISDCRFCTTWQTIPRF